MVGLSVVGNLSFDETFKIVSQAARRLNYAVLFLDEGELAIRKGSFFANLIVGAAAVYCNFRVSVQPKSDGAVEVLIRVNRPWWSGIWGMRRVRGRAEELADAVASALRERGGKIVKRSTN
jgi:hypothetical protein